MSRTFEVLERVQQDQGLFRVPPVTKEALGSDRTTSAGVSTSDLYAYGREEVLRLVQCLFLATHGDGHHGPRRVVFCGIDESDSSNLLCARVGRSLAEQVESQVCVVDSNLRVSAPNPLFDLPPSNKEPQSQYGTTPKFTQRVTDNLCMLSSESITTDGGARTLDQLQALISGLSGEFTHWVISAAPIGLYSDAALLGQMAEGVVFVLEANSTRRAAARKAKQSLEDANVRVLGVVLNGRTYPIPEKIYRRL
jgi:Mrp family chromosome partitioning ATPase